MPGATTYWPREQAGPTPQLFLLPRQCLRRGRGIQERGPSSVCLGTWAHLELHVHQGSAQVLVCGLGACGLEAPGGQAGRRVHRTMAGSMDTALLCWVHGPLSVPAPSGLPAPLPLPT